MNNPVSIGTYILQCCIRREIEGERYSSSLPKGNQLSVQNRVVSPFPTLTLIQGYAISLMRKSLLANQENFWLVFLVQKLLKESFKTSFLYQATHKDPELQKRIQMSFNTQALFHATRSLQFKPPSDLLSVIVSQETRAE